MTERITPEQATLTPEIIAEIRSLDAQRDPECRWLMQTAEIRWRLERLAANCIIPALDEIERLTGQNTHLLSLLWKIHVNNKRGLPDGVREQIESLPYVPPYQPPAEEGVTP